MADGTVIVGVAGILTAGIFGPVLSYHIAKDREARADRRDELDAATTPLVVAQQHLAWAQVMAFRQPLDKADLDERLETLQSHTFAVEGHALKLRMRFGESELVKAYSAAGGAVNVRGGVLFDISRGALQPNSPQAQARFDEAGAVFRDAYKAFLREAERWHAESS